MATRILISILFFTCFWTMQSYSEILEFNRKQILLGEIWRIWTAHLVHTNITHLLLNISATLIIYFGFFSKIKSGELLLSWFIFSALISIILLYIYPNIAWYSGLSGLLHALVSYFCIRLATNRNNIFWLGLMIVWIKVLVETICAYFGNQSLINDMIVITEAHLIGAFVGTITAFIYRCHQYRKNQL